MAAQIRSVLTRSSDTFLQDALGAVSLCVMLVVGLHLPAFF
ncbi:MAG: hypothetical protein R3D53_15195 [Paracoccaceae bacterium]|jgi:hypothetical protein